MEIQIREAIQAEAQKRGCSRLMLFNLRKRESYQRHFYPKHGWEERADAAVNFSQNTSSTLDGACAYSYNNPHWETRHIATIF